ncbi:S9 family peptidase [Flavobacterium sp. ZT3R18]|uniref:S9 family peptidase n=1 Tax=Flavobacterium sp. ZT3R18 TaxID=2594429 RepID=UPI00117AB71E|nr:prolyl oligopeptidase family serine peptidase [Flavobacterium sp. ZT3R18]TRX32989.1 S9 family peptidase [Flavobacterium sp. ZT3R18]
MMIQSKNNKIKNSFLFRVIAMLRVPLIPFLVFILPLVTCPLWGQVVQKKQLTSADYHLWGELQFDKIAPNGKWASYRMGYESGADTLFVRNTESLKTYAFPAANNASFGGSIWFACQVDQELRLLNLKTGKLEIIADVTQYAFSADASKLVLLKKPITGENTLLIRQPEEALIEKINGVHDFKISTTANDVAYWVTESNKNAVGLLSLGKVCQRSWILKDREERFQDFTWEESGKAVAFYSRPTAEAPINGIYYYNLDNKTVFSLDPKTQSGFPTDANIANNSTYKLSISDDFQKVFFAIKSNPTQQTKPDSDVELWNGNAKWIYPMQQKWGQFQEYPHLAVWYPMGHRFDSISTAELPKVMLNGNQHYAILSNPQDYEPQFEYEGPRDFYIVDLATREKNLFLRKHSIYSSDILPSPSGKYIAYFKEKNWWVYDIIAKTHTNVTLNIKEQLEGKIQKLYGDSAFGNPGWSANDDEILIYDQYDIWAIKPDGTSFRKLTHGREKQIQFRIPQTYNGIGLKENFDGWKSNFINLEKELVLRAEGNDGQSGYFKWKSAHEEKPIVYGPHHIDQFTYAETGQNFIYREQNFDRSPKLIFQKNAVTSKLLFQSNPQQEKYSWGKSELIEYYNSKGINLKGVLFYPANYDPQKKYPMIVHIYEKQSNELHHYVNPSQFTEDGQNITVFTTQGYFVLYPDIKLEIGNPGIAAADCTISATKEIIARGLVIPEKIGLIGHSFGGYETAFIITQTGLFATAAAGGAITDLNSMYLTVGGNSGKPDMWRFQNLQWRITKSPFEDPLAYNRNSPVACADKITTPLLLWSGKQDQQVDWHQSIEFYLALRRLNKKHIMLLYPNEKHSILNQPNQKDLLERVQDWFGYYLKDELPVPWINEGIK